MGLTAAQPVLRRSIGEYFCLPRAVDEIGPRISGARSNSFIAREGDGDEGALCPPRRDESRFLGIALSNVASRNHPPESRYAPFS